MELRIFFEVGYRELVLAYHDFGACPFGLPSVLGTINKHGSAVRRNR